MNFDAESLVLVDFDGGAFGIVCRVRGFAERSHAGLRFLGFPIGLLGLVIGGSPVWPFFRQVDRTATHESDVPGITTAG
jgi:hypothetical protein